MPLEIHGITLKSLHNDEYIEFMLEFMGIVDANNPTALQVKVLHDAANARLAEVQNLFRIEQGSDLTNDILAADNRRDEAITGISGLVDAFAHHFDDRIVQAAQGLQNDLAKYHSSNIARESLAAETTIIAKIADDWTNLPNLSAWVGQLGIDRWVAELKTANDAFRALYASRDAENAAKPSDKMIDKRNEMNQAYLTLRKNLNAHTTIHEFADPWGKTVNICNETITKFIHLIATHPKRKKPVTT